jgi:hypothetical protein
MNIPDDKQIIIEPFVGNGDLLHFINNVENYTIECYDIEPKIENTTKQETLKNPPYLARNKNKDKFLYDRYKCNDLYKCFLTNIIENTCSGGIVILPLNFICSIRKQDIYLRKKFLSKYSII